MTPPNKSAIRALITTLALLSLPNAYQFADPPQRSQELTFCAKETADTTLKTFWAEATGNCPKDPDQLITIYQQMRAKEQDGDKCSKLLSHQLRKSLIDASAAIFEDALASDTYKSSNVELQQLSRRLAQLDGRILLAVWERTVDAVYFFLSREQLAATLYRSADYDSRLMALLCLYRKYERSAEREAGFLSLITQYLTELRSAATYSTLPPELKRGAEEIFTSLPASLQMLYAPRSTFGLLNAGHWEYLYCPRDNGPDANRRTPLTWTAEKNVTDSDGQLVLDIDSAAHVAIASLFGLQRKYLFADEEERQPYFWIGQGAMLSRWWRVVWHKQGDYLTFENVISKLLLCAIKPYDENRRFVTLNAAHDANKRECGWIVAEL